MYIVRVKNTQSSFLHFWPFHVFSLFWGGKRSEHFDRKRKHNWEDNGKTKTVYGSPGRGGPHLSGDVQSPNVFKSIRFGKVFMRENRAWQIEEFRGPQRGPRVPGAPGGKRKKTEWTTEEKKTVRPGCPRGGKQTKNRKYKKQKVSQHVWHELSIYIYIYTHIIVQKPETQSW